MQKIADKTKIIHVTVTDEQYAWLERNVVKKRGISALIREILQQEMDYARDCENAV